MNWFSKDSKTMTDNKDVRQHKRGNTMSNMIDLINANATRYDANTVDADALAETYSEVMVAIAKNKAKGRNRKRIVSNAKVTGSDNINIRPSKEAEELSQEDIDFILYG